MQKKCLARSLILFLVLAGGLLATPRLSAALSDGLVSYYPLDEVQGTKTPDLVSGYDMNLSNLTANDVVPGKVGKAFSFSNARQTLLSRVHAPGDDLPINKHPSFTIAFWAKAAGTGQNDLRFFSEANTTTSNPLFNIGTHNGGADGTIDFYIRQTGWTTVDHVKTIREAFDDTWHHVVFVQNAGERAVYIDGVRDELAVAAKPDGTWNINNTSIGGILRASASHWVTGLIDDVALWKRALTDAEIKTVAAEGLKSVFSPLATGLVSHWPLNEIQGTKTPDVVSGFDLDVANLTVSDVVAGKVGKAISFSNQRQTLLSRVHAPTDDLPINKHPSFTIAFWAKAAGTGQNDLRFFSEANTTTSNPLFNIGTHSGGADGTVDIFIRQTGWTTVNHVKTIKEAFDDTWRHVVFVQNAGARAIYIDGTRDELVIEPKPDGAWNINNTSIGGILRASASHWVTGLIDEVAVWKRALSDAEITEVFTQGVPVVTTRRLPLEIRTFTSDFPRVVSGGKVFLRWDASKDAALSIDNNVGNVTANTIAGVGAVEVTVNASTTYTLTATRGNESISKKVTVGAQSGAGAGWQLLDNFESYSAGPITGKGAWKNPEGSVNVVDLGLNKVVGYDAGGELAALPLRALSIKQGQKGTLFFRVYGITGDVFNLATLHVGLTERPIRFVGDFNQNVGPYIRFEKFDGDVQLALAARNGVAAPYDFGLQLLDYGSVYNVWIDVDNLGIEVGDIYSIHIQKQGAAQRTTVFDSYISDRDPLGSADLGLPTPDLDSLFFSAPGGNQGTNHIFMDDFYISVGSYNSSVPLPPSSFVKVDVPKEIRILGGAFNATANSFTLTWGSSAGLKYNVQKAASLGGTWTTVASGFPSAGATGDSTSYTDTSLSGAAAFYRVAPAP